MRREDLILKDECFRIVGVLFEVYKKYGGTLLEKHYQKAIAEALKIAGLKFSEQVLINLFFGDKVIGKFYADFLIEINGQKIILEIKKNENFGTKNIHQLHSYLKALNLQLGILANFTTSGVKFKRIVNLSQT